MLSSGAASLLPGAAEAAAEPLPTAPLAGIPPGANEIYLGFERQLTIWQRRYAGRPEVEMLRLYLLALEREENVTVAYNETVLGGRLAGMCLQDDMREIIQYALGRVWKDEEWHTIYVRGLLLNLGRPLVRARAFVQEVAGALGGWTVSVRQHRRWMDAPVSRAAATLVTWAGGMTGRVPREVRRHLDYCSFRDFCRYNVETEGTAWLCWRRLTELALHVHEAGGPVNDFRRIADDEARHRQIFRILAEVFTDKDRLRQEVDRQGLASRIGAVGEGFLRPC